MLRVTTSKLAHLLIDYFFCFSEKKDIVKEEKPSKFSQFILPPWSEFDDHINRINQQLGKGIYSFSDEGQKSKQWLFQ